MAKNDTKTIFNVLSAKARKKEITNTDRKEVRQAVADLAAEIQGGYRLSPNDYKIFNEAFKNFNAEIRTADSALPDEQRTLLRNALTEAKNNAERLKDEAQNNNLSDTQADSASVNANTASPEPGAAAEPSQAPNAESAPKPDKDILVATGSYEDKYNQALKFLQDQNGFSISLPLGYTKEEIQLLDGEKSEEISLAERRQIRQAYLDRLKNTSYNVFVDGQVYSITAPEELSPENIRISDNTGKLLFEGICTPLRILDPIALESIITGEKKDYNGNMVSPAETREYKAQDMELYSKIAAMWSTMYIDYMRYKHTFNAYGADRNDNTKEIANDINKKACEIAARRLAERQGFTKKEAVVELLQVMRTMEAAAQDVTAVDHYSMDILKEVCDKFSENPLADNIDISRINTAENRQAALDSITTEKKPWTYSAGAITPAAIAAAMASNEPDKALSNIDDLVAAQAYYKDDKDKSAQLDPIVENRLKNLSLSDITPANAESYRLLCLQCGNEELRQQALNLIADAIIQYDKEHFGSFRPNTEELAANYDKAHAGLKDKDPFACKHDPDKDTIDLGSVEFTDAAGKPLSEKEAKEQKAAISALAREMAAQRLAKQGSYTPEELEQAYKDAAAEIVWGSQPKYGKNGKPQVDKDALASTIANQYLETETFKDRCKQKFKDNPLVKKVSNNVEKIDKKLEKRYGKKYVYAKQALKFVGKISGSVAKNAAIYGAAGLIPGGTAVVIGYNICKNWKNIKKQLKDPNASTAKKCAMVMGACATTALSGLGIVSGIGTAAEAINTVSPGMVSSAANFMGQLGTYGRMGISAAATMLPNLTESVSLRIQNLSLNRKIKKEKDGEKLQQLIANQKALQVKIKNNKKEMLIKGGSLVAGMAAGQALMPHITELIQESVDNGTEIVKKVAAEHGIDPWKEAQTYANDAYANVPEGTTMLRDRSVYDPDGILRNSPSAQMAAYMAEHDPAMHGAPDEISGIKAHETNLAAAKAENSSGIEGKSAFAHTLQHLESLGDSRITDTNAVAEGISEHVGKNANLATIACKMAPHALQQVLQLEGLPDNNPSSYNMIQYMASHDLTPEQHTALNNFIQNNFDGAQFKAENFADYRAPAHDPFANADQDRLRAGPDEIRKPTLQEEYARAKEARQEYEGLKPHEIPTHPIDVPPTGNKVADYLNDKYACSNDHGVGFKFEPLNESDKRVLGIEEPQQTVVVQQPVQETVVVQQQPQVDIYSDPTLYAQNFGLVYDPYLSNGLNRIGSDTHGGYLGAFIDPRDNSVTLVPNDPLRDKPVHYDSYQSAKGSADHNIGAWDHSGHERNMIYDPDKKITRCFGSGYITHNNTINKVIAGINTAGAVLNTINWIREGRG